MDADGIRTQLSPENGWSFLKPPTFVPDAVVLQAEPVFRATGIEHVLLNVADPEPPERPGTASFRDPDGMLVQVSTSAPLPRRNEA